MIRFIRSLICFFNGHDVITLQRHGGILKVKCLRCGGLFAQNKICKEYEKVLLKWDKDFEQYLIDLKFLDLVKIFGKD
jgi:hypothetical protein